MSARRPLASLAPSDDDKIISEDDSSENSDNRVISEDDDENDLIDNGQNTNPNVQGSRLRFSPESAELNTTDFVDFSRKINQNIPITPTESGFSNSDKFRSSHSPIRKKLEENPPNSKTNLIIIVGFFITVLLLLVMWMCLNKSNISVKKTVDIKSAISEISSTYSTQKRIVWEHLQVGIERLVKEEKEPAIFFMTQWSEKSNIAYNIAMDVGNIVIKNLSGDGSPITLSPKELNTFKRGDIIEKYQNVLQNRHVLIVKNIEQVSPNVAQDFRYFCDEFNPIVGKAAIFFIMNMKDCENVSMANLNEHVKYILPAVENCLTDIWGHRGGLDFAILRPVLSRIINQILPIGNNIVNNDL